MNIKKNGKKRIGNQIKMSVVQNQNNEGVWWKVVKGKTAKPMLTDEEKKARADRYNKGYEEAVNCIFDGVDEKIKKAEEDGKDQVIVYTFRFAKDPKSVEDEDGKKVVFGDRVRLMDILTKGYKKFVWMVMTRLNKEGENKYRVGYFKKSRDGSVDNEQMMDWNIFVSWRSFEKKGDKKVNVKPIAKKYVKKSNSMMMDTSMIKKKKSVDVKKDVKSFAKINPNSWAGKVVASLAK